MIRRFCNVMPDMLVLLSVRFLKPKLPGGFVVGWVAGLSVTGCGDAVVNSVLASLFSGVVSVGIIGVLVANSVVFSTGSIGKISSSAAGRRAAEILNRRHTLLYGILRFQSECFSGYTYV